MDWEPVAVIEGGVVYYVRADHIGRPAFATDVTGTVVWSASYLPFGEVRVSTGALPPMRFPGQWFQAESGLHQNWMRDYDPTTGRYLQPDPLGLIDGPSAYGYADQNPGRWVDPRGENTAVLAPLICVGPQAFGCAVVLGCAGIAAAIVYMATGDTPETCGGSSCASSDGNDCDAARQYCIDHCSAKWMENTKGPVPRRADRFNRCISECLHAHGCLGTNWGGKYYP